MTIDADHIARLHPDTRTVLSEDDVSRIAYINRVKWIPYPRANKILDELENLFLMEKKPRMDSCLIIGDSNNGKSSLAKEFFSRHPPTDGLHSPAFPVVLVKTPNTPDEGRLYNNILKKIGVPFKHKDAPTKKEHEVHYYLEKVGTLMLILDDIHNILSGTVSKQKIFLSALRSLNDDLFIAIVLLGIKEALRAVGTDDQIINRFPPLTVPRWQLDADYVSLLASIETLLPLMKASNLATQELALKILDLSEGLIGEIFKLISKAAVTAILTKTERITLKELAECGFIVPSKRRLIAEMELG